MNERLSDESLRAALREGVPSGAPGDLLVGIVNSAQAAPQLRGGRFPVPIFAPVPALRRVAVLVVLTALLAALIAGVAVVGSLRTGFLRPPVQNGPIVFVAADEDIHVVEADGTGQRVVLITPQSEWGPSWSPAGAQIAFVRLLQPGSRPNPGCTTPQECEVGGTVVSEIFLVNPDGSAERQLTSGSTGTLEAVDWSPDGAQIAYAHGDGNTATGEGGVFIVDVATGQSRLVFSDPAPELGAWSLDGTFLVMHGQVTGGSVAGNVDRGTFVVPLDGRSPRRIGDGLSGLDLSPDGRQVTGWAQVTGAADAIRIVSVDGSGERTVAGTSHGVWPIWSPDGTQILYTATDAGGDRMEVWVIGADGSNPTKLADGFGRAWSPDGTLILFSADGGTYSVPALGGAPTKLTSEALDFTSGLDWLAVRP